MKHDFIIINEISYEKIIWILGTFIKICLSTHKVHIKKKQTDERIKIYIFIKVRIVSHLYVDIHDMGSLWPQRYKLITNINLYLVVSFLF